MNVACSKRSIHVRHDVRKRAELKRDLIHEKKDMEWIPCEYLISIFLFLEKAEEAIVPAFYLWTGRFLGASSFDLGLMALMRLALQAIFSPLAAILAVRNDRLLVAAVGIAWTGFSAVMAAVSSSFFLVRFFLLRIFPVSWER